MSATGTQAEAGPAELNRLCVFCGSSMGTKPEYMAAAKALGSTMAAQKVGLVYGGGTVGLMGEIARTVQAGLGDSGVIGVIPEALAPREVSGQLIGETYVVQDMHTRKAKMAEHADGFIAMPGGFGTLEELLEVVTWQQLGFHTKPIGLLNTLGFFDKLLAFFQHSVDEGFIKAQYNTLIVSDDPKELIEKMRQFKAPRSFIDSMLDSKGPIGVDISVRSVDAPHDLSK